jgi:hypothetical protein
MSAFPCPLAPFEHLMWLDDHADYPMAFPIIGELRGEVDRERAQAALEAVCARHPLLAARVTDNGTGRPQWVATPAGTAKANAIEWREDSTIAQRGLDLAIESGVQVEFLRDADRWRMVWHFHHCCCDGVGAAAVIGEWLLIYDALASGRDWRDELKAFDEDSFARRARIRSRRTRRVPRSSIAKSSNTAESVAAELNSASDLDTSRADQLPQVAWWRRLHAVWSHLANAFRVVSTTPAEMASANGHLSRNDVARATRATSAPGDGIAATTANSASKRGAAETAETVLPARVRVRHWEAEQLLALRREADSRGATVNDLLLTSLVRALHTWNQRYAAGRKSRPVRVMMPTNQRIGEDRSLSAANVLSYAMLDRTARESAVPAELLDSVRRETAAIARHNLSIRFMISLGVAGRWPRLLQYALKRRGSWATAVLSNLGDVSRRSRKRYRWESGCLVAGGLRLEAIYGAPPIRRGTRVALGVSVFRQRLTIAALFDPRHFSADDQEEFLDRFRAALAELVGGL